MYMYEITEYTKKRAKELGVEVRPSVNSKKKVDVWQDGKRIASIGAQGYMDFGKYLEKEGEAYAKERQRLYKIRHIKNRTVKGSNGWWSDNLLW
jgi:anaerobic glycerol-3-phosphate dehydrogenase